MILIAESGSSKTDWRIITKNGVLQAKTIGLNPYYQTSNSIIEELDAMAENLYSQIRR